MRMLQMMLCVGVSIMVAGCALREGPTQDYTSTTGSMGDAGTVELADLAGRNVLGIRSGIIRHQKALKYLQDYITRQCL